MRPALLSSLFLLSATTLSLSACSTPNSTASEVVEVQNALSQLCFDTATERIDRRATPLHRLFMSDAGNLKGAWDFDLFYGIGRPKTWGGLPVLSSEQRSGTPGSFEVAYKHIPITSTISGKTRVFRRVTITVTDLSAGTVIAERQNILFGNDFNRGWQCLDADWFRGNESFVQRVLGRKYIQPEGTVRQDFPTPTSYVKAQLLETTSRPTQLRAFPRQELLPNGSVYNYKERRLKLLSGEFYLTRGRQEPLEIAKSIETKDRYFFVLLPDGHVRSWPLRQILVEERLLSGELVRDAIVQIPPVFDWTNGWGLNPDSIDIKGGVMVFQVLGAKRLKERYADQDNDGSYGKSYQFQARLW
jgi:hypothetical protein